MIPWYALPEAELLQHCQEQRSGASGPGGQHANRHASGVRYVCTLPDGQIVQSEHGQHRERQRNKQAAIRELRLRMALQWDGEAADMEWLTPFRRGTKLKIGPASKSYHLVVAVLMAALRQHAGALGDAARFCGLSSSQFGAVLTAHKLVHQYANKVRTNHGLGAIRS